MPAPQTNHTQRDPGASARLSRGARLRGIILVALERRRVLQFKGVGAKPEHVLAGPRMRLEQWLNDNPVPSNETVVRFGRVADVATMLPANAEGLKLLDELREVMAP